MLFFDKYLDQASLNLALEEVIFRLKDSPVFLLYQNEPSIIVGHNQDVKTEVIDNINCLYPNISIIRRMSGGGAVYQDRGNLNYSFIFNKNEFQLEELYEKLNRIFSNMQIGSIRSERNDFLVEDKKFSGTAVYEKNNRIIFHGTLLFDVNIEIMDRILTPEKEKLKRHAVSSVASRVINLKEYLKITFKEFKDLFIKEVSKVFELEKTECTPLLLEISEKLAHLKYKNSRWTYNKILEKDLDINLNKHFSQLNSN